MCIVRTDITCGLSCTCIFCTFLAHIRTDFSQPSILPVAIGSADPLYNPSQKQTQPNLQDSGSSPVITAKGVRHELSSTCHSLSIMKNTNSIDSTVYPFRNPSSSQPIFGSEISVNWPNVGQKNTNDGINDFNWSDLEPMDESEFSQLLNSCDNLTNSQLNPGSLSTDHFRSDFFEDGMDTLMQMMDTDGKVAINSNPEMNSYKMCHGVGSNSEMSFLDAGMVQPSGFHPNTEK